MTDKTALRAAAIHELGERFDDALETARGRVGEARGAVSGLRAAEKAVETLATHADRDVEEEKLTLDEAKLVKTWLARAQAVCSNLALQSENRVLLSEGEVRGMEAAVGLTKKAYDAESAKLPAVRPVDEASDAASSRRPSVKQRRLSEAKASPAKPVKKRATKKRAAKKKATG